MDRKTRKIIAIYGGIHPRPNVERLHLPRSKGRSGLVSIEDCVNDERKILALYALRINEKLIIAATIELKLKNFINVQYRQERRKQRLTEWKEKALHGQFLREIESTNDGSRWDGNSWNEGNSSVKQKALLCAALKESLRVNAIKYSIDKISDTLLCRLCNEKTESITHTVSACSIFAKSQYRKL